MKYFQKVGGVFKSSQNLLSKIEKFDSNLGEI